METFPFHPYLFEVRASVAASLSERGFVCPDDYAALDVDYEHEGIEVAGIRERAGALRIAVAVRRSVPAWPHTRLYLKDWGRVDPGWRVLHSRNCAGGDCHCGAGRRHEKPRAWQRKACAAAPEPSPGARPGPSHAATYVSQDRPAPGVVLVLGQGTEAARSAWTAVTLANAVPVRAPSPTLAVEALRKGGIACLVVCLTANEALPAPLLEQFGKGGDGTVPTLVLAEDTGGRVLESLLARRVLGWVLPSALHVPALTAQIRQLVVLHFQLALVRRGEDEVSRRVTELSRQLQEQVLELRYRLRQREGGA